MRRATESGERGMPRLRQERLLQEDLDRRLLLLKGPQKLYELLGPKEKWREHIDGRHQHFGKQVYTSALHMPREPDPAYNARMLNADRYISTTFGKKFTAKEYQTLRKQIAPDSSELGAKIRSGPLAITFRGFEDRVNLLKSEEDPYVKAYEEQEEKSIVHLRAVDYPLDEVDKVFKRHYQEIKLAGNDDEKLRVIARTHKSLENLHPYVDYNTRTNRLVLNRLLAEQGLPLTILQSPLDVHHLTVKSWVAKIQSGQEAWLRHATEASDPTYDWQLYDKNKELMRKYGFD